MQTKIIRIMSSQIKTYETTIWGDVENKATPTDSQLSLHLSRQGSMWVVITSLHINDKSIASQSLYYDDVDDAKLTLALIESRRGESAQKLYDQQREAENYIEYMANGDDH